MQGDSVSAATSQPARGRPVLLVLSGPSGVGKDAVLAEMKRLRGNVWHFVVTATTRPPRLGERDGVDYVFMSHDDFERKLADGGFLEYANVYGRWYGVPRDQVQQALERGQDVILKVDVQGAATIKKLAPDAVFVFLSPPDLDELERRLRTRKSDSEEQIRLRMQTARQEMGATALFDYTITNENGRITEAVQAVEAILAAERHSISPKCPEAKK